MLNGKGAYAQGVRVGDQSNQNRFAYSYGKQDLLSRIFRKWCLTPFLHFYLIDKPSETLLFAVRGDSMMDAGIHEGDFVVVERTRTPNIQREKAWAQSTFTASNAAGGRSKKRSD